MNTAELANYAECIGEDVTTLQLWLKELKQIGKKIPASQRDTLTNKHITQFKRLRMHVLQGYGGICACCGETTPEFLCIDHVHNNGNAERKTGLIGVKFYRHIIKNRFPSQYQLLCYNCNMGKAIHGTCPHSSKAAKVRSLRASRKIRYLLPPP